MVEGAQAVEEPRRSAHQTLYVRAVRDSSRFELPRDNFCTLASTVAYVRKTTSSLGRKRPDVVCEIKKHMKFILCGHFWWADLPDCRGFGTRERFSDNPRCANTAAGGFVAVDAVGERY